MHPEPAIDIDRIDDTVLALLFLGLCERDQFTGAARAWKTFDWAAMDRLYEKGLIDSPRSKAKSVWLTDQGLKRAEALFYELFARAEAPASEA